MKKVAIIPARGGSKRIPKKNIKIFEGKPIIAYTIEIALQSGLFDEVIVSTDSEEIAQISIFYGATVPFLRSEENSNDFATTIDVINEVLDYYAYDCVGITHVCCLYPTAPMINLMDLIHGFDILVAKGFEVVYPIVEFSYPIWRGVQVDENGYSKMVWSEFKDSRSQDLKKVYHDAGQWYWINNKKRLTSLLDSYSGSIIIDEMRVQDIDTENDWKIAELKYKLLKNAKL